MKKYIIRAVTLFVLVSMTAVCFTGCNRIKGKYIRADDSEYYEAYEFFYFNDKFIYIYLFDDFQVEGQYEIDEDAGKIYITLIGDRQEFSYSKEGKTIYIDGVPYVKYK